MSMDDLICKSECEELIYRAARTLDEGDLRDHLSLYADDATLDFGVGPEIGIKVWAGMLEQDEAGSRAGAISLKPRIVTNLVVMRTGPDTADARAYVTLPDASHGSSRGEWSYQLRRTDKGWRIGRYQMRPVESEA